MLCEEAPVNPTKSPIQRRREMGRRMKLLAKKSSTKLKKQRALTRKRDTASLMKSAQKQAKMTVIKKQLGPEINYNELPIQKRIQIDQKITAKKAKVIQKMTKKILRKLKAGEGERVKKAKLAQQES